MRKIIAFAIILAGLIIGSCTKSEEGDEDKLGSIYGIVTELGTAEPMKAVGVELYKAGSLLLKTVTFDDGHFEFKDLNPEKYQVKVVADGYEQIEEGYVTVEAGRQARIDLQVRKAQFKFHMSVRTLEAILESSQVILGGEYSYESSYAPTEVGFVYATQNNPKEGGTLIKSKVDNVAKSFSATVSDLNKGIYYYQAYAKNSLGTEYGEVRSFKVGIIPIVKTLDPTNVLAETATLNGLIESEGEPAYTERGFVYSKSYNTPTVDDPANATTKVPVSGRNKTFSAIVSSFTENSTYYVRAYVTNENGTFYGEILTFIPKAILPVVTTLEATNILATSATLHGRIDNAGEPAYTERGFLYSISYPTPTINDPSTTTSKVVVDGTSKEYSANVSALKEGTTYYVRAYATSSKGTSYGEVLTFKPVAVLPSVTTLEPSNVQPTTATLNGRIDKVGEPAFTERGFIYSTSYQTPTVNDPSSVTTKVVVDGNNTNYSANISSLTEGTTYYVRAYATSEYGTAYGEVLSFKYESSDYVIIDNLMIQKNDLGWASWDDAEKLCKNSRVAGFSDWRLPTIEELALMYTSRKEIPNLYTPYSYSVLYQEYWSSTFDKNYGYFYYSMSLYSGETHSRTNVYSLYVRAVRTVK